MCSLARALSVMIDTLGVALRYYQALSESTSPTQMHSVVQYPIIQYEMLLFACSVTIPFFH